MPSASSSTNSCATARSPTTRAGASNTNWISRKQASPAARKAAAAGSNRRNSALVNRTNRVDGTRQCRNTAGRILFHRVLAAAEASLYVIDDHLLEIRSQRRPAQRSGLLAVDEYGRRRLLPGSRQRNADIGVLRLPPAVVAAAHHPALG